MCSAAGPEEFAEFEADVLSEFVLARAAAGLRNNEARSFTSPTCKRSWAASGSQHNSAYGKSSRGSGPRERMVPLINNARRSWAGTSRMYQATSTTTTPATAPPCSSRKSADAPAGGDCGLPYPGRPLRRHGLDRHRRAVRPARRPQPSPVVALNRAIAVAMRDGPEAWSMSSGRRAGSASTR